MKIISYPIFSLPGARKFEKIQYTLQDRFASRFQSRPPFEIWNWSPNVMGRANDVDHDMT